MNRLQLTTHGLRRWVNQVVDATITSPSLAEMVCHHVEAHWGRVASRTVYYRIEDTAEIYLHLEIVDARGYTDNLFERGRALMGAGINGVLMSPSDEASLEHRLSESGISDLPILWGGV